MAIDPNRKINWKQMGWLAALSIATSITALILDEVVMIINGWKLKGRTHYFFWVLMSMLMAACAVSCI